MRSIYRIVIHYTASKDVGIETIRAWHKARGWKDVGYHKIIRQDGSIENGRAENERGAHAGNYNEGSLGVVLTGSNQEIWYPAKAQYDSLNKVLRQWISTYSIVKEQIFFHRELSATSCPGRLDKKRILRELEIGEIQPEGEDMGLRAYQSVKPERDAFADNLFTGVGNPLLKGKVFMSVRTDPKDSKANFHFYIIKRGGGIIRTPNGDKNVTVDHAPVVIELPPLLGNFSIHVESDYPVLVAVDQF